MAAISDTRSSSDLSYTKVFFAPVAICEDFLKPIVGLGNNWLTWRSIWVHSMWFYLALCCHFKLRSTAVFFKNRLNQGYCYNVMQYYCLFSFLCNNLPLLLITHFTRSTAFSTISSSSCTFFIEYGKWRLQINISKVFLFFFKRWPNFGIIYYNCDWLTV